MVIGNGVDIIEVKRVRQASLKWGNDFLKRIFTDKELKNAESRVTKYEHLAGRFAAKEAVFKALLDKEISWKDIEISNDKDGRPVCTLLRRAKKNYEIHISISHVKNYAVASAVVIQKS
ncbi:MAG: holo-ACP synthase [Candidatus Omnitrophica bacterium]|nr:holo-ACP synthase [Candidatus Omnitrophota bacterium]MDD5237252.1 holo-ACP synthase [Candidatus Omnitrophota bacterium]MDD5610407.1 holo-ACP synthase [Candidatus Omnitrophota bacterium]